MKLKFKKQPYQSNAVEAVADCFAGQPKTSGIQYHIDPGKVDEEKPEQKDFIDDAGFKNSDLVIPTTQLLENIKTVQKRQNLPLSHHLVVDKKTGCNINLDIEMETGTGKTYC